MDRLKDKVAFITGSGAGIGRASAILFSKEGAKVVIAEINESSGNETARLINQDGGQALYIRTDVTDPESVKGAIKKTIETFGSLNLLYNNAGGSVGEDGSVTEVPIEVWQRTHAIDLFGTFLCCKFGIPELIKTGGGAVIVTSSIAGLTGWRRSAYTAAKGGLISLTRVMAVDYARYNIRVNCLCPGLIVTERSAGQMKLFPHIADDMRPFHLLGLGEPDDVAHAALFLASDEAKLVTGVIFSVDSGYAALGRMDRSDPLKKEGESR
ncbi:MAG: SDR family oxidoreductase [Pseudomonadota bacterium]